MASKERKNEDAYQKIKKSERPEKMNIELDFKMQLELAKLKF